MSYDKRNGSPYDRGAADSYYQRGYNPHYYVGGTYQSERVEFGDMTAQQIVEYSRGYSDNEADPSARKDY